MTTLVFSNAFIFTTALKGYFLNLINPILVCVGQNVPLFICLFWTCHVCCGTFWCLFTEKSNLCVAVTLNTTSYILRFFSFRYSASAIGQAANVNVNNGTQPNPSDDLTPDYMNILGMIFSMCALMMRIKWAAWLAIYCSCISFANTKFNDDTKQIMSSFMLSISAVVMSYLQNPAPMSLPGTG